MNCPNCGAPMILASGQNHLVCEYCATHYIAQPNQDGVRSLEIPTGVHCPVCASELMQAQIEELRIKQCPNCKGILIEQPIFAQVVRYLRLRTPEQPGPIRPINAEELKRKLKCPSCGRVLDTHAYGGPGNIVIDTCMNCALVWLDHSEMNRVLSAPGRDREPPQPKMSFPRENDEEDDDNDWLKRLFF